MTTRRVRPIAERFWEKVDKNGPVPAHAPHLGPCWLWAAATDGRGYGAFAIGQRTVKAHQWSWTDANGPMPAGLEPDHLCRTTLCVRPSHMEAVTHGENISRARRARTECRNGHDLTDPTNVQIRKRDGARLCLRCTRQFKRDYKARRKAGDLSPRKPGPISNTC